MDIWKTVTETTFGYGRYLFNELTHPHWKNYIYWLVAISLLVMVLEWWRPWREKQPLFRKDFWLDGFYMFFNFFLFSLVGFAAVSTVSSQWFLSGLKALGISSLVTLSVAEWPVWTQLLTLFLVRDFVHFNVHRLLHRVPLLWEFHKVHHSVREMGFSAHLRYHWMENVVYRTLEFIPLAMIGFGVQEFIVVHLIALTIGHLNHANFRLPLGPLKYIFNNSQMHIWHHVGKLPEPYRYGINFGISLSLWDYLFGTACIPHSGRDIELGFENVEAFPETFLAQAVYPLGPKHQA